MKVAFLIEPRKVISLERVNFVAVQMKLMGVDVVIRTPETLSEEEGINYLVTLDSWETRKVWPYGRVYRDIRRAIDRMNAGEARFQMEYVGWFEKR